MKTYGMIWAAASALFAPGLLMAGSLQSSLSFEKNVGQTDSSVRYLSRGPGYTVFLKPEEATLRLQPAVPSDRLATKRPAPLSAGSAVHLKLVGANPHAVATAAEALAGETHYFLGNDSAQWRTDVPTFGRVRFEQVYPGIDVVYYGNEGQLEHDFVVHPGANPSSIRLAYSGVKSVAINRTGDLVLNTGNGELVQQAPVIYQKRDGARVAVRGSYVLSNKTVRIQVGAYDHSQPLIIDPILTYATNIGGSGAESGNSLTRDASGNLYVTGFTTSATFPSAGGAVTGSRSGGSDVFVVKYNPAGTMRIYTAYIGGSSNDSGYSIAVDPGGNAYVTGTTSSTNFPVNPSAHQRTLGGADDAFVTKLNSTGGFVFSTYLGGSGDEFGEDIAVDEFGGAYLCGYTESATLAGVTPPTGNVYRGAGDGFVARLSPTGANVFNFVFLGGTAEDHAFSVAVSSAFEATVVGSTQSRNFLITPNAYRSNNSGNDGDGFVTRFSSTFGLRYSSYLGGAQDDYALSVALIPDGSFIVGGSTVPFLFPATNLLASQTGGYDGFVMKFSPDGSRIVFATVLGGGGDDRVWGVSSDPAGNVFLTGTTESTDFPLSPDAIKTTLSGTTDIFAAKINPAANQLLFSTYLGGSGADDVYGHNVVDPRGMLAFTGVTDSANFPTTANALQPALGGQADAFMGILEIPQAGPQIGEVVDGGSFRSQITGNSWVTIRGSKLSNNTRIWEERDFVGSAMPTQLDGVRVTIDGSSAFIYYVSPGQLNVLAPALTKTGPVTVVVTTNEGTTSGTATVAARVPAFFMLDPSNRRYVAALKAGTSAIIGPVGLYPTAPSFTSPLAARNGLAEIYATGLGDTTPPPPPGSAFSDARPLASPLTMKINGIPVVVQFAGVVAPGLYQINIVAPDLPPGDYSIEATVDGVTTQTGAFITLGPPLP